MRKGFTIIELMVVVALLAVLAAIAMPMFADYSKRSKAAEVPLSLKTILQQQVAMKENPETGRYATDLATLVWVTSNGTTVGKYYEFGTNGVQDCDPGSASSPIPIGLAEAWAINPDEVVASWLSVCLDENNNLMTNTLD